MRVEGDDDRRAVDGAGIVEGPFNDGPVPQVDAIKYPNRENQRSGDLGQIFDGEERFQSARNSTVKSLKIHAGIKPITFMALHDLHGEIWLLGLQGC